MFWTRRGPSMGMHCFNSEKLAPWAPGFDRLYAAEKARGGMPGMWWHWQTGMPKDVLVEMYDAQHPEEALQIKPPASFFGVSSDKTAEQNDLITKNSDVIWGQITSYPFPSPLNLIDYRWCILYLIQDDIKELAGVGKPLDPELVRMWLTFEILKNYEAATNEAQRVSTANIREEKAHARKIGYIKLGMAAFSAVLSLIVPAAAAVALAAVNGVITALKTRETLKEQKEMATTLSKTAQAFEETDKGFAAEIQKASDMVDAQAAQEAASQPLPPEPPPPPSTGVSPLVVGGGIAAVGLAVLALFRS